MNSSVNENITDLNYTQKKFEIHKINCQQISFFRKLQNSMQRKIKFSLYYKTVVLFLHTQNLQKNRVLEFQKFRTVKSVKYEKSSYLVHMKLSKQN